ncbi:MAG: hypothetical protein HYV59_12355 [Planctomycetes bacterium]|nr:hypothetical protein [Planctomycetota bacterium]
MKTTEIIKILSAPIVFAIALVVAYIIKFEVLKCTKHELICLVIIIGCPLLIATLAFLYFASLSGHGGIEDWKKVSNELSILKREDIQKSLSELNNLSIITERYRKTTPVMAIIDDYSDYLKHKKIESVWIFGVSLGHTSGNIDKVLLPYLEKGIKYQYLCTGDIDKIRVRAKNIAKYLWQKNLQYISAKHIRINHVESQLVPLPIRIYNLEEGNSEIFLSFPSEIENTLAKKYGILLTNEDLVETIKEDFIILWDKNKNNELTLENFCSKENL